MKLLPYLLTLFTVVACGWNLYDRFVPKDSDRYRKEQVRIHLDNQEYAQALSLLEDIEHKDNDTVLMKVSAFLGNAGLSMWGIVKDLVDSKNLKNSTGTGADRIFNVLGDTFFGTGDVRTARLSALSQSIQELKTAPDPETRLENFRCFLAGVLAFPSITDGKDAALEIIAALQELKQQVAAAGGSGDECPSLDRFNKSLAKVSQVRADLDLALTETVNCPLFASISTDSLNEVEKLLDKFNEGADQGCETITCTLGEDACEALQFGCIQSIIGSKTAQAGDGKIEICEIVQNCSSVDTCF
ncbi:MAG: hypothetical protein HYW48_08385 [Deltaproteobacteria bacterium]|nr:hypothetical protein [Deltaproteobacteria bacterium]